MAQLGGRRWYGEGVGARGGGGDGREAGWKTEDRERR